MPVTRRYYDNPTKPKRCNAIVPDKDGGPGSKCTDRTIRSGLCGKHYNDSKDYRETRRKTITRHRLGIDLGGKMTYGTVEGSTEVNWCSIGKCRRRPIINLDNTLYCQICFMKEQKKRQRLERKHANSPSPNRLEAVNVNER